MLYPSLICFFFFQLCIIYVIFHYKIPQLLLEENIKKRENEDIRHRSGGKGKEEGNKKERERGRKEGNEKRKSIKQGRGHILLVIN